MPSDNVDIWKKVIFSIPSFRKLVIAIFLLGSLYSALMYSGLEVFTHHTIHISLLGYLAAFVFILPTLASGELLHRFIDDYPREWGYFLALCNQTILFVYSLILTGADNFSNAWRIFWIAIITVYLSNFFVLLLTLGYRYLKRISLLSLVQPGLVVFSFHIFLGSELQISFMAYLANIGMALGAGAIFLILFFLTEYLIGANVQNVSVLGLTSGLLHKKQEKLDLGFPTKPDVQTLKIENEDSEAEILVPWIHPGPLEGFGGGKIATDIIESLNQEKEGFFFHVPSTHKSDPTDPEDYKKILDAASDPETVGKASKLLEKEYEEVKFYGRKINGKKIVFLDTSGFDNDYDDYEISVFRDIIDTDETLLVDLHSHERELLGDREEVWYNTEVAERLRDSFRDFIKVLDQAEKHEYSCGFEADAEDTKIFSLVEGVDGEKTLIFGIEGNEKGEELAELEEEYSEQFDKVLVFTTDTHRSIHELSQKEQIEKQRVRETVEKAIENLSRGSIGFSSQKADQMNLLQEDYSGLVFSINILVRLIPIALVIFYLSLVIWIW